MGQTRFYPDRNDDEDEDEEQQEETNEDSARQSRKSNQDFAANPSDKDDGNGG